MTNILQVKLLSKDARMPERNHETDAGYDIFSAETVVLEPQEKAVIKQILRLLFLLAMYELGKYVTEQVYIMMTANDDVEAPSDYEKIRAEVSW